MTVGCCCLALSSCSRQNAAFSFLTLRAPCPYIRRVTVVLLPDAELGQRMEGEEKARIEAFRKTLDEKQVGRRGGKGGGEGRWQTSSG